MTPDYAWAHREGRITRYANKRVGGTVCVHFIKKNMWFLETALTFLEMQDTTELETSRPDEEEDGLTFLDSKQGPKKSSSRPVSPSGHQDDPDPAIEDIREDPADPDVKEHSVPDIPTNEIHVLFVQPGSYGSPVRVESGGAGDADAVIPPVDEFERSERAPEDNRKPGTDSSPPGEPNDQGTTVSPPAGHFSNGSRRFNQR